VFGDDLTKGIRRADQPVQIVVAKSGDAERVRHHYAVADRVVLIAHRAGRIRDHAQPIGRVVGVVCHLEVRVCDHRFAAERVVFVSPRLLQRVGLCHQAIQRRRRCRRSLAVSGLVVEMTLPDKIVAVASGQVAGVGVKAERGRIVLNRRQLAARRCRTRSA